MKIAVDAFGGDNAPIEIIKGAAEAAREYGVTVILAGNEQKIKDCADKNGIDLTGTETVNAEGEFDIHTPPTEILKSGRKTSLGVAFDLLADGKADALVSAGSTGAIVVGATFIVKRIKGVKRPALGTVIPGRTRRFMIMDVGANADCRAEMLAQFGVMASVYMQNVENVDNPQIGLLNIGAEDTKGGTLQLEAYKLLKDSPINFIGNVEARDVPAGVCDAVIADGFTGNIALKLYEGVASNMMKMIKGALMSSLKSKIAALLAKKSLYGMKKNFDYSEIGGAPLLGVRKPVIKAHGSSDAKAVKNAVRQAVNCVRNDVVGKIAAGTADNEISGDDNNA